MIEQIKRLARNNFLYDLVKKKKNKNDLKKWSTERKSFVGPLPHLMKQFTIKDYAAKFNCFTLIETGTFEGDMVEANLDNFTNIYSIELDDYYFKRAFRKFRNNPNVQLINGDSGVELGKLLLSLHEDCVFWLDGHYSAGKTARGELDTPILSEILSIFNHPMKNPVILIDDARLFNGENDYPKLDDFIAQIGKLTDKFEVEVYNDIIRITPARLLISNNG